MRIKVFVLGIMAALAVIILGNQEVLAAGSTQKLESKICIDDPAGTVVDATTQTYIEIRGWALNSSGISQVKVYVDGKYIAAAQKGLSRLDVDKAIPGYKGGANSGYKYKLSLTNISTGAHKIKIQAIGADGTSISQQKTIEVKRLASIGSIDEPASSLLESNSLKVRGWALNTTGTKNVKVYLNNTLLGSTQIGLSRSDVYNVFPQYSNANSGFQGVFDISSFSPGKYTLKVVVVKTDLSTYSMQKTVEKKGASPQICIDEPSVATIDATKHDYMEFRGWALNGSGISQVKVYVDGKYIAQAQTGLSRPDVNNAIPGYKGGANSGYKYSLALGNISTGSHKITIQAIGADGSSISQEKTISVKRFASTGSIDEPGSSLIESNSLKVAGWALNSSDTQNVKVYLNNTLLGNAEIGISRPDVYKVFPQYGKTNSGYKGVFDISSFSGGKYTLKVIVTEADSSTYTMQKTIEKKDMEPLMAVDEPGTYVNAYDSDSVTVKGWALNSSGVKQVKISIDGVVAGSAALGYSRSDVAKVYSNYIGASNSGYQYNLNLKNLSYGNHTIKVESIGFNGVILSSSKSIYVSKNRERGSIDQPQSGMQASGMTQLTVQGWSVNESGTKSVGVYIDGVYKGNAQIGISRPDVASVFPAYAEASKSGFKLTVSISGLSKGTHTVTTKSVGNNGKVFEMSSQFKNGGQVIVIDPGHGGSDSGAYKTFNGINYCERDLNMQVSLKLKSKLEALGYTVIMTRNEGDGFLSLESRSAIANNSGAVLFISIHHDSSTSSSAEGVSTHWSSWRPNIDGSGLYDVNDITYDSTPSEAAVKSGELSRILVNNIASSLGYVNRGSSDHNLNVTRNTNMMSLLLECGFISNPSEAAKAADAGNQQRLADVIANTIDDYLN